MSTLKVGVLGGGQLGRMLMESANRLNIQMSILDTKNAPAKQISAHDNHIVGHFNEGEGIRKLAEKCDVITAEIEHVDTYALEKVAEDVRVEPSWKSIRIIQDKFQQKEFLKRRGVPMVEHRELKKNSEGELRGIGEELGYRLMLKSKTQAYDGRGNYVVRSSEDISAALEALGDRPLYAEKWVTFKMELAVMVIKSKDGVQSFPTVQTVQEDSICKLVYAPAPNVSDAINQKAQELARKAVSAFDGRGVFGVEMFLLEDDTLLLCELASRVHNSGHYTIEACPLSQFDAHLRAILDLPIPPESLVPRQPAIMLNILGGTTPDSHLQVAERALSIPNASLHMYSKGDGRPGRKMGHITVTAATMYEAELHIRPLIELTTSKPLPPLQTPPSRIAVMMGSDSDRETLRPGLELLEDSFGLEVCVDITSAHRTPSYMAECASSAASQGVKVIIAAAGGAAHLPGMVAAQTTLPVIGVPVKGSCLDGMDSLLSIVQMPRGVPVATVGINNSINAAILAARILGATDPQLQQKVADYAKAAEDENLNKSAKMRLGWRTYLR
ncbi:MAG: phosphoribosylaminoimidazole carboxylase ade2 [Candelina submexicana]|nr:MAG: phosphoribosylaminoimidazole carboxylase ade2 [Candelina submexicana]